MPNEPRGMWCSNHLCEAAILQRTQQIHTAKLRGMKPQIDMRDPRRPKTANSKGARMEEERNQQIMHENTILLTKLSKILTREGSSQAGSQPEIATGPRSLHEGYKRREREKIDRENHQLLRRLQYMKPCIDVVSFEQDWQLHAERAERARAVNGGGGANPLLQSRVVPASAGSRRPGARPGGARPQTTDGYVRPAHMQTYLEPLSFGATGALAESALPAADETSAPTSAPATEPVTAEAEPAATAPPAAS